MNKFYKTFLSCLIVGIVFLYSFEAFSQRSRARSSSSSRSSARSSTSRSSARSSTSRSSARSSTSRSSARSSTSRAPVSNNYSGSAITGTTNTVSNPCDIGRVLQTEEDKYYWTQTKTCNKPENSVLQNWSEGLNSLYSKPSWIDGSRAIYFACDNGFVQSGDKCVTQETVCPLDMVIGMPSTNNYVHPETGKTCVKPLNTKYLITSEEDIIDQGLDYDKGKAASLICSENYFSAPVNGSSFKLQCVKCPNGGTSKTGTNTVSGCSTYSEVQGDSFWENYGASLIEGGSSSYSVRTEGSSSKFCKAGTYLNSAGNCESCPDYQWSNDRATSCSPIKFKFTRSQWTSDRGCFNSFVKETPASSKLLQCTKSVFGDTDNNSKGCGAPCNHIVGQNGTLDFSSCKKLPCIVSFAPGTNTADSGRILVVTERGDVWFRDVKNPNAFSKKSSKGEMVDW